MRLRIRVDDHTRVEHIVGIQQGFQVAHDAVKARFNGEVEVLELEEPDRAKLKAHGSATGSVADAISEMHLSDGPDGSTNVHWTADVNVSGQLASLAARLMVPVSQKLASQFYDQVKKKIETENTASA